MNVRTILVLLALFFTHTFAIGQQVYIERRNDDSVERDRARNAAVKAAQGEVDRAQISLDAVNTRLQASWKANPDLQIAERDLVVKQAAYDKARQPIIAKLMADPAYRAAAQDADAADAVVKQEQGAATSTALPTTQPTTIPAATSSQVQAATIKLQHKTVLRDMEEKAIAADTAASTARDDLDAARARMKALQLQYEAARLNNAEYKAALDQMAAARSRLTAASGQQ